MGTVLELLQFLAGLLIILIPGIWICGALSIGKDFIDRIAIGSCIGLALCVYLGWMISQLNLSLFYPVWVIIAAIALMTWLGRQVDGEILKMPGRNWIWAVLLLVAFTRFAPASVHPYPDGTFDPTFHLLLARKIQIANHAITDWQPFEQASLNYPTGVHTLMVIVAALSRLPLHIVFKYLIASFGVISTAQMYAFARRVSTGYVPLFSTAVYGLWSMYGSIDYARWGGLPNQLAMLLFLAMLTVLVEPAKAWVRVATMALLFTGDILVHNHVMVASGWLQLFILVLQFFRRRDPVASWKLLAAAILLSLVLASVFLVPYAKKIALLHSTMVLTNSEPPIRGEEFIPDLGTVCVRVAAGGLVICLLRLAPWPHPIVFLGVVVMLGTSLTLRFVVPAIYGMYSSRPIIPMVPSRFLTDAGYFLPIFAGVAIALVHEKLHSMVPITLFAVAIFGLSNWSWWRDQWKGKYNSAEPAYVAACSWIRDHTSPTTIVMNSENWTAYCSWRRTLNTPLPDSEAVTDRAITKRHAMGIIAGEIPPDSKDMEIVQIVPNEKITSQVVVWKNAQYSISKLFP